MGRASFLAARAPYGGINDHSPRLAQSYCGYWPDRCQRAGETRHRACEPLAVILILLETVGGLCVALGFLTRFFAVAIAVEMAVIVALYFPKFGWTGPGYEYPLMWGLVMLAIALRGGGPYSIDRRLGREL